MYMTDFKPLETPRLILRDIRMEDIQQYYEDLFSDGDVCRYLLFDPHQDIGESLQSIEKILEGYAAGGRYCWAITRKEEDVLIGVIGLTHLQEDENSCSFSYLLCRDQWNRGYGTEAVKAVIAFALEELQVDRVWADHMAENPASGAVMRKAGMHHVGTEPGKYKKQGFLHDAEVYEITRPREAALTANRYQELAMTTRNPAFTRQDMLLNAVMGLCGESGEAIDLVKKHLHQGHGLDRDALAKELGDIAWYLAEAACGLDLSLEDILRGNLAKLKARYPQGFSAESSIHR